MSGQTLCLSLRSFLRQCNWQGFERHRQIIALSQTGGNTVTAKPHSWQCLSVKDFFGSYDWQGYAATLDDKAQPSMAAKANAKLFSFERHQTWQCLAVADFLGRCDWQGQTGQWQPQQSFREVFQEDAPKLSPPSPFQCLPVQEFFTHCNWQGSLAQREEPLAADPTFFLSSLSAELIASYQRPPNSSHFWQCQTVEAFFGNSNWKGKSRSSGRRFQSRSTSAFTLPVDEFFERFSWENQPQIAAPPKQTSAQFTPERSPDFTLTNLTKLF